MKKTVILFSLMIVLLLAGICSCKQEATPETLELNAGVSGVTIPKWEKGEGGLQNLPDAVVSGTGTGVSEALVSGLKNPPEFQNAHHLIVMVCEGLTPELMESSVAKYGDDLILNSLPVKGTTTSKFTSSSGKLLEDYIINERYKSMTGMVAWGETSTNSLRRMTTSDGNEVSAKQVNYNQFRLSPPLCLVMGKGDFEDAYASDALNALYKSSAKTTTTLGEAIPYYKDKNVYFYFSEAYQHYGSVEKLYVIFENDATLPSFRQETAFALAWMQSVQDDDGFGLMMSYSPSSPLDETGVQDFDEAVAVAVKFVLENPDTALLICGCPVDGSEASVCFYGLGKGVSARNTLYECVTSLYE